MVCADVPLIFQHYEPLPEYIGAAKECVGNCFGDIIREIMVVKCDRPRRYNFHHCPDWRVIRDAVFGNKMSYFRVVGCLAYGIGDSLEKPIFLIARRLLLRDQVRPKNGRVALLRDQICHGRAKVRPHCLSPPQK